MMRREPTTPINVLIQDYQAGATVRELAARYGTSFQNIAMRLQNAGIARPIKQLAEQVCPTCGKTYRPSYSKQRFCNATCIRNKTHCVNGHLLTEENRYHYPSSNSRCKLCAQARDRAARLKRKAQPC
jgi:hypothetical protein